MLCAAFPSPCHTGGGGCQVLTEATGKGSSRGFSLALLCGSISEQHVHPEAAPVATAHINCKFSTESCNQSLILSATGKSVFLQRAPSSIRGSKTPNLRMPDLASILTCSCAEKGSDPGLLRGIRETTPRILGYYKSRRSCMGTNFSYGLIVIE